MPITFKSRHSPDMITLETVGQTLLRLMKTSGTVPGALAPEDIPAALAALRQAVTARPARPLGNESSRYDDDSERHPPVGLAQRAGPLIAMLETALAEGDHVSWDH